MSDVEVPRTLSLLWGREEVGRRGPKRTLDIEQIGRAAITIADREGLAGLSMKRVADELGVTSMALYRYLDSKDDLLLVMLELASEPPRDELSGSWREALDTWSHDYRALLGAHPWILQVPLSGPPATPRQLAWMELALAALEGTTLSVQQRVQVLLQLSVYVRGDAALNGSLPGAVESEAVSPAWAGLVAELADPERFPSLCAMLATDEFDEDDDPLEQFEFGLQRMLDGIETLNRKRRPARRS